MSIYQILGTIGFSLGLLLIWFLGTIALRQLAKKIWGLFKESILYNFNNYSTHKWQAGKCKYDNEGYPDGLEDRTRHFVIPSKGFRYRCSATTTVQPSHHKHKQSARKRTPYNILLDKFNQLAKIHNLMSIISKDREHKQPRLSNTMLCHTF